MPDGTTSLIQVIGDWLKYIFVALLGMFGWNLKRQVGRIDDLSHDKLDSTVFNDTLKSLRESIDKGFDQTREDNKETRRDINTIHARIDKILEDK